VIRTSPRVGLPLLHACARLHIFNHAQKEEKGGIGKSVKKRIFQFLSRKKRFLFCLNLFFDKEFVGSAEIT
jgi:hypothetical protein